MKITFLGTGTSQGVPVIACDCSTCLSSDLKDKRLRTSVMLETDETMLVIDAGPDFRQQMLREHVSKLDAIILTHEHRVQKVIKKEYSYVFSEYQYPGIPKMRLNPIAEHGFSVGKMEIIPVRVFHYRLPVYGFRVGNFAYITDANYIPEESKEKLFGVKYLVVNALRKEKHISHFCLREALDLIREISPKKAFITHISHQMGLQREVSKELPPEIKLAYDGLSFMCDE